MKIYKRRHTLSLHQSEKSPHVLAKTVTHFRIGDGSRTPPVGLTVGEVKVTRMMLFDFVTLSWGDEIFFVENVPLTP